MSNSPHIDEPHNFSFAAFPLEVINRTDVPLDVMGFLLKLMSFAHTGKGERTVWPRVNTIAAKMKVSTAKVSRLIKACLDLGLIERDKRYKKSSITSLKFIQDAESDSTTSDNIDSDTSDLRQLTKSTKQPRDTDLNIESKDTPVRVQETEHSQPPSKEETSSPSASEKTTGSKKKRKKVKREPTSARKAPSLSLLMERWRLASESSPGRLHPPPDPIPKGYRALYHIAWRMGEDLNSENPMEEQNWDMMIDLILDMAKHYDTSYNVTMLIGHKDGLPKAENLYRRALAKESKSELGSWEVELADSPV